MAYQFSCCADAVKNPYKINGHINAKHCQYTDINVNANANGQCGSATMAYLSKKFRASMTNKRRNKRMKAHMGIRSTVRIHNLFILIMIER